LISSGVLGLEGLRKRLDCSLECVYVLIGQPREETHDDVDSALAATLHGSATLLRRPNERRSAVLRMAMTVARDACSSPSTIRVIVGLVTCSTSASCAIVLSAPRDRKRTRRCAQSRR